MQVAVASKGGEFQALLEGRGIIHFPLDQTRRLERLIKAAIDFRGVIGGFRPDIVHRLEAGEVHVTRHPQSARLGLEYGPIRTVTDEIEMGRRKIPSNERKGVQERHNSSHICSGAARGSGW